MIGSLKEPLGNPSGLILAWSRHLFMEMRCNWRLDIVKSYQAVGLRSLMVVTRSLLWPRSEEGKFCVGTANVIAIFLVFRPMIKWQAVPIGLTNPSRCRVDHLMRPPLWDQKAFRSEIWDIGPSSKCVFEVYKGVRLERTWG